MGKYIDAEYLKELLNNKYKESTEKSKNNCFMQYQFVADGLFIAEQIVDSLQQEQQEVDLEKEIDAIWNPRFNLGWDEKSLLSINHSAFETIARHFYELGLNARKV